MTNKELKTHIEGRIKAYRKAEEEAWKSINGRQPSAHDAVIARSTIIVRKELQQILNKLGA